MANSPRRRDLRAIAVAGAEVGEDFEEPRVAKQVELRAEAGIILRRQDGSVDAVLGLVREPVVVPLLAASLLLQRGQALVAKELREFPRCRSFR